MYTSLNLPAIEISGAGGISFRLESFARFLRLVGLAYFSPKFHGCSVHLIVLERSYNAFPPRQCVQVTVAADQLNRMCNVPIGTDNMQTDRSLMNVDQNRRLVAS